MSTITKGKRMKIDPEEEFIKITKFIFDRRLTYATGGNWVFRCNKKFYCTPTGLGRYYLYELEKDDIIICDENKNIIQEGTHRISVAAYMHMNILEEFPEYNASIHTHGEFSSVFATVNKPIPSKTIAISYYCSDVPIIGFRKNFDILQENIIEKMREIKMSRKKQNSKKISEHIGYEDINQIPVAVLIAGEGLMIAAPDLRVGITTAEAIEENARCIVYSSGILNSPFLNQMQ